MSAVGVGLSTAFAIGGAAALGSGIYAATGGFGEDAAKAAQQGSGAQVQETNRGINVALEAKAAAQQQADAARAGLDPYAQAGTNALRMQQALAGSLGPEAQAQAYASLQESPAFASLLEQGQQGILANASATGGLRGGNTQAALAQFGPQLLQQMIEQQYGQLAGLSGQGFAAASQQGGFGLQGAGLGMQGAGQLAGLYDNRGAYRAGGILGETAARLGGRQQALGMGLQLAGTAGQLAAGIPPGGF